MLNNFVKHESCIASLLQFSGDIWASLLDLNYIVTFIVIGYLIFMAFQYILILCNKFFPCSELFSELIYFESEKITKVFLSWLVKKLLPPEWLQNIFPFPTQLVVLFEFLWWKIIIYSTICTSEHCSSWLLNSQHFSFLQVPVVVLGSFLRW